MNKNVKRKIKVTIAGRPLTIVTDESDFFVRAVCDKASQKVESLMQAGAKTGNTLLDCALLCVLDACGEELNCEKRIRNLETQLALCEINIRNLKEKLEMCRQNTAEAEAAEDSPARLSNLFRIGGSTGNAVDTVRSVERYLEEKSGKSSMTKEEKIRYIESLLRGGENDKDSPDTNED